jgi:hypothetical protein
MAFSAGKWGGAPVFFNWCGENWILNTPKSCKYSLAMVLKAWRLSTRFYEQSGFPPTLCKRLYFLFLQHVQDRREPHSAMPAVYLNRIWQYLFTIANLAKQCGWEWGGYIQYMPYLVFWRHRRCSTIKAVQGQSFVIHPNVGWWQSTNY